ncbi:hypothetical protein [Pantoea piersonii]|uniref:Uncharacterized protein n=1 Tax=Pantoea piersonii TaxID=2364647 RepID=A0AAJ5UBG2_9GAMM|nr:hypothetical protein [Pantoea piersonii]WBG93126.1 hypothetical protein N5580_18755 [Pantoea piersonii]
MTKKKFNGLHKKGMFSLLFLELTSLLLCIPVGYFCAISNASETSVFGVVVIYLFLSMAIVPFIHKRFILKERK